MKSEQTTGSRDPFSFPFKSVKSRLVSPTHDSQRARERQVGVRVVELEHLAAARRGRRGRAPSLLPAGRRGCCCGAASSEAASACPSSRGGCIAFFLRVRRFEG